ncbi:unnamed protein product [Miscanthus lutarioriparius]|uniref:Uncharacterized protein n=1 Tax=Miscanthus lutarioriparius TaxID=422564 RepID=A0A811QIF1_9POAL|nr:unnamed protein product [Miscanthus lutarioriparius]
MAQEMCDLKFNGIRNLVYQNGSKASTCVLYYVTSTAAALKQVCHLQCHRGRVSSICSDSSAPTDSVSLSAEPLVPIEPLLLECDKVSSCRLSLNPSETSDIVGFEWGHKYDLYIGLDCCQP